MSLHYILDGYNLLNRRGFLKDGDLCRARSAFLSYLETHRPQGSRRNQLTVVFDGASDLPDFRHPYSFAVVFSRGKTADERIKEMLYAVEMRRNLVVVSDDRDLISQARSCGAQTRGTAEFLGKGPRKVKRGSGAADETSADKSTLNIVQRESITEELKKLWLKKKSS